MSNSASSRFTETCGLDIGLPRNRLIWRGLQMSVISTHAGDLYKPITVPREDRHLLLWVCRDWNNQAPTFTPCAYWTNLLIRLGEETSSFPCFLIVGMGSLRASSEVWVCTIRPDVICFHFHCSCLSWTSPGISSSHLQLRDACLPFKPGVKGSCLLLSSQAPKDAITLVLLLALLFIWSQGHFILF